MNLQQIRQSIIAAEQGKLDSVHICFLIDEISKYKEQNILPQDVKEWYEHIQDIIFQYEEGLGGDWEG